MKAIDHFRRLFTYDAWANGEVLSAIKSSAQPPLTALKLLAHILAAERLWLERLLSQPQTFPVWPDFSLHECEFQAHEMPQLWQKYLAGLDEASLSCVCNYSNTKGEPWSSRIEDVLQHVIMHSAYHRGQIAREMRAAGHVPAMTDFIHAVRQGLMK